MKDKLKRYAKSILRGSLYGALIGAGLIAMYAYYEPYFVRSDVVTELVQIVAEKNFSEYKDEAKPNDVHILPIAPATPIKEATPPVLVFGKKNTLIFRDVVNKKSVGTLQKEALKMSNKLTPSDTIYLVLDTPGGDISAGSALIDSLQALPQRVKTVTLFAASMGFHIVQSMDERLITPSGTLMSHRAKIGGLGGEIPGEAVVAMNYLLRMVLNLDKKVVARIGMPLNDYQRLIADEYWVDGQDSVDAKMADKVVLPRCSAELIEETYNQEVATFFGNVLLVWSKCPIIAYPVSVDLSNVYITNSGIDAGEANRRIMAVKQYVNLFIHNKKEFVRRYITNGEYTAIMSNGQKD